MIPSRGLRWSIQTIGTGRRRLETLSVPVRQFSSSPVPLHRTIRAHGLLSMNKNRRFIPGSYASPQFSQPNTLIRTGTAIRFASSTTPTVTIASSASSTPSDFVGEAIPSSPSSHDLTSSLDSATDFASGSIHNIPESIGYLNTLGLDYGFGPTTMMQFLLEHVHVYAGTPWWVSISITGFLVRAALFKIMINSADNAARLQHTAPITKPLTVKMAEASRAGDKHLMMQIRSEIRMINRRAGIKMYRSLLPMLQVFAGYGTFVLMRAMSKLPVPGLETGGVLWFQNLTLPDPLFLLPIAGSVVLHWSLRKGGEIGQLNQNTAMAKFMLWGLPTLTLIATWWLPACLQLSFLVTGFISYLQGAAFRNPWFRSYFNMTQFPVKKDPSEPGSASTAKMRVLDTKEIDGRFEAVGQQQKKKGVLGNVVSEVSKSFSGVVKQGREKADEMTEKGKAKKLRDDTRKYEEVRKQMMREKEMLMERQREAARRARRQASNKQ
ncbi:uncharacterized protein L3040_002673 [Drepanopeziza brunnea f. sp. 'multigermtubi']|uniref:uncharacterized protein n=1 Tax=Drepanopeziza brunnea f. sp. 'multigermtubi' TaxID=698441 RepID=UPI0023977794|nr:hypothetical protein L3040_002673 [Drepanopeziza brunnea f. sp. 'multigermtubi']